jgi:hypothetical protein
MLFCILCTYISFELAYFINYWFLWLIKGEWSIVTGQRCIPKCKKTCLVSQSGTRIDFSQAVLMEFLSIICFHCHKAKREEKSLIKLKDQEGKSSISPTTFLTISTIPKLYIDLPCPHVDLACMALIVNSFYFINFMKNCHPIYSLHHRPPSFFKKYIIYYINIL